MPAMHQSQQWLMQCGIYGLGCSLIVRPDSDKSDIYAALEVDASIDDNLDGVIQHAAGSDGAVLLDRKWNRIGRPPHLKVVYSMKEFFDATAKGR